MLIINSNISIPDNELLFSFARSSGPGGQNVNKVNSKAILHWSLEKNRNLASDLKQRFIEKFSNKINSRGEVVIACDTHRDSHRNIEECRQRLKKMLLAVLTPPKKRIKTKATKASKERRIQGKKYLAKTKEQRKKPTY